MTKSDKIGTFALAAFGAWVAYRFIKGYVVERGTSGVEIDVDYTKPDGTERTKVYPSKYAAIRGALLNIYNHYAIKAHVYDVTTFARYNDNIIIDLDKWEELEAGSHWSKYGKMSEAEKVKLSKIDLKNFHIPN